MPLVFLHCGKEFRFGFFVGFDRGRDYICEIAFVDVALALHGVGRYAVAGYLCSEGEQKVVGLEVNANHMRSARGGRVRGVCKALHVGTRHQVWQIEIFDEQSRLCCSSRLTTAVI